MQTLHHLVLQVEKRKPIKVIFVRHLQPVTLLILLAAAKLFVVQLGLWKECLCLFAKLYQPCFTCCIFTFLLIVSEKDDEIQLVTYFNKTFSLQQAETVNRKVSRLWYYSKHYGISSDHVFSKHAGDRYIHDDPVIIEFLQLIFMNFTINHFFIHTVAQGPDSYKACLVKLSGRLASYEYTSHFFQQ